MEYRCSKCFGPTDSKTTVMCPECHEAEVTRVHAHDTPSAPAYTDWIKWTPSVHRQCSSGGWVVRKATTMS